MATQFTATVKPSGQGGDYTSLSLANAGLANDLTLATIKVFSISAYSTPTIAAGDTVLDQTTAATGVCVLVNAARTQILIKTIAVASFNSGDVVQKTTDPTRTVTLSSAGDSPIAGIAIDGDWTSADTTAVTIDGWTTSAANYIKIYTTAAARHDGKWNEGKYRLEMAEWWLLSINADFVRIDGLQLNNTWTADSRVVISMSDRSASNEIRISNCIIRGATTNRHTLINTYGDYINLKIWNNILYDGNKGIGVHAWTPGSFYIYNNTIYNCTIGIGQDSNTIPVAKNNIAYNNDYDFNGTFDASSDYNFSKDDTAPGTHSIHGTTDGKTPDFVNTGVGTEDFHLQSTSDAIGVGTDDPGAGLYSDDIDGVARTSTWDIGADEYVAAGGLSIPVAMANYRQRRN